VTQSSTDHDAGRGERSVAPSAPADAPENSAAGTFVIVVAAILVVAAVVFIVVADNVLRARGQIPDILQPTATAPPRTPTVSGPRLAVATPPAIEIDLPLPESRVTVLPTPTVVPVRTVRTSRYIGYAVEPGDTLAGIASRFGFSFEEIAAVNGIDEPWTIQIGETILIPRR